MKTKMIRPVAIVGGVRIPFARSGTAYADLSNLDMLAAALQGLIDAYQLEGQQLDSVVAGAVTTHAKDFNLAREAVLSTSLSPLTPGVTMQQACGTSLQAAFSIGASIAAGQQEVGIAAGTDSTSDAPIVFSRKFAQRLMKLNRARDIKAKLSVWKGFSPGELAPVPPSANEPRTGLSMGQHCELMAKRWQVSREDQDQLALASHNKAQLAYESGFFDDLVVPCAELTRDNNLRYELKIEQLKKLNTAFDKSSAGTLTAGNSTPLTDGAAGVLLASEDWAKERDLPVLAYLTDWRTAAVDFVGGEGLLMAPTVAVSELLERHAMALQDFDAYELHEAFAAQVLCNLEAWKSADYCRERLGRKEALGEIDFDKLNLVGSSLAVGHPFAATGARILGTTAKLLEQRQLNKGLISICAAGGMGVAAIVERA